MMNPLNVGRSWTTVAGKTSSNLVSVSISISSSHQQLSNNSNVFVCIATVQKPRAYLGRPHALLSTINRSVGAKISRVV